MGMMRQSRMVLSACLLATLILLTPSDAVSQQRVGIPTVVRADSSLQKGVDNFEAGQFAEALTIFEQLLADHPNNASSSAARIMAAKSAYRMGRFTLTLSFLSDFSADFPSSGYLEEASHLSELASSAHRTASNSPQLVGILLSLSEEDRVASQAIFNGVRLAVEMHNSGRNDRKIKMIYRDVDGGPPAARRAVRELSDEGVTLIIGTLYSEEAIAAADQAERERIVFIAPLATDERVSDSRTFSFQANPSMRVRGEVMARFAINGLRLNRLGVIAASDNRKVGERLSDGFIEEASRMGADLVFIDILPDESYWYQLPDLITADTLDGIDALYVPLATRDPVPLAGAILSSFDRVGRVPRLLGNAAWHDLPQRAHASVYTTTYSNDFLVDEESFDYRAFAEKYFNLSGTTPDRLGITGYDVTTFGLRALSRRDSRQLHDVIRNMPAFEGLGMRIHFEGGNVNRYMFYHRYRNGTLALIR